MTVPRTFRFESVLRYRAGIERRLQGDVAAILGKVVMCERRIEELVRQRADGAVRMEHQLRQGIDPARAGLYTNYIDGLEDSLHRALREADQLQAKLQKARETLLVAAKDKRAVEKLRERHQSLLAEQERKAEQKFLDDVAGIRHGRLEAVR